MPLIRSAGKPEQQPHNTSKYRGEESRQVERDPPIDEVGHGKRTDADEYTMAQRDQTGVSRQQVYAEHGKHQHDKSGQLCQVERFSDEWRHDQDENEQHETEVDAAAWLRSPLSPRDVLMKHGHTRLTGTVPKSPCGRTMSVSTIAASGGRRVSSVGMPR